MSRRGRSDALIDRPKLLTALGACRAAVIEAMGQMKVTGPLYYSASTVIAAIDALALMLTGQRSYFDLKGHGGTRGGDGG
jgi:hypothetical protein